MFDIRRPYFLLLVILGAVFGPGCKDDLPTSPVIDEVKYGETTIVVMLNPVINDANEAALPSPGIVRSGVRVSVEGGPSDTTDASDHRRVDWFRINSKSPWPSVTPRWRMGSRPA